MPERRKLHPAAIAVYSADALRNAAFPLLAIVAISLLGGGFDARGLLRAAIYGAIGVTISMVMGYVRWSSTTYWVTDDVDPPPHRDRARAGHERAAGADRGARRPPGSVAAGCSACSPSTCRPARRGKGGEISLPALTPDAVQELREARPHAAIAEDRAGRPAPQAVRGRADRRGGDGRAALDPAADPGRRGAVLVAAVRSRERRGGLAACCRTPWTAVLLVTVARCSWPPGCCPRSAPSSPSRASRSPATATGCGSGAGSCSAARPPCPSAACAPCAWSRASCAARSGSPR